MQNNKRDRKAQELIRTLTQENREKHPGQDVKRPKINGDTNYVAVDPAGERVNKLLARLGICSRREADAYIAEGRLTLNSQPVALGTKVTSSDDLKLDGQPIKFKQQTAVYLALNKPCGIVCTTDLREKNNIVSYLGLSQRIFPIGRLDKDSSGLILLTNDGAVVNEILRERYNHSKEYEVTVDRPYDAHFVEQMQKGVKILGQITKPCHLRRLTPTSFRLTLTQGLNRQIRRMCQALGYNVVRLQRIRIMQITLGNLAVGEYRYLTDKEIAALQADLSHNRTVTSTSQE